MENISRSLLRVSRKAQTCIGAAVKKYDLTIAEQPFFMAVRANDGMTQEELTSLVGVDKAMTTRVIQSLEKKGLVQRVQDESDKRQKRIYKTDEMEKMGDQVLSDLLQLNRIFTRGISAEELDKFYEILNLMDTNVSQYLDDEENV